MKRSKDVYPLKSLRPSRAAQSGCWNCLHEVDIRPGLRSNGRASRLDLASHQRKPSYLRQDRQHRPAFNSYSWAAGLEKGFVAALGEARRYLRRGHLNMARLLDEQTKCPRKSAFWEAI